MVTQIGRRLTEQEAYQYAIAAGFPPAEAVIVVAIGKGESDLYTGAIGDTALENTTWGPSIGVMQIRSLKAQTGTGGWRDIQRLTDPAFNFQAAKAIRDDAGGFTPWSVYTSGKYREFLSADGITFPNIPSPADVGSALLAPLEMVAKAVSTWASIAQRLLSPLFWKRVGIGAGGMALLIVGLALIVSAPIRDKAEEVAKVVK